MNSGTFSLEAALAADPQVRADPLPGVLAAEDLQAHVAAVDAQADDWWRNCPLMLPPLTWTWNTQEAALYLETPERVALVVLKQGEARILRPGVDGLVSERRYQVWVIGRAAHTYGDQDMEHVKMRALRALQQEHQIRLSRWEGY